jgi:S1-C subfamily serine protease
MLLVAGERGEPAVVAGSPAARAGMRAGDIILELNGIALNEENDIASLVRDFSVGETVTLKVWQASSKVVVNLEVTLGELK